MCAWSNHDRKELHANLPDTGDREWFVMNVHDAKEVGKKWLRQVRPDSRIFTRPLKERESRHELHLYMDEIGSKVPRDYGAETAAKNIRKLRNALAVAGGNYRSLPKSTERVPSPKSAWTNVLRHNEHDCRGMREVVLRAARELDTAQESK